MEKTAISKKETPSAEELLKKIQELEEGHVHLKQEMSKLLISGDRKRFHRQSSTSVFPYRPRRRTVRGAGGVFEGGGSSSFHHYSPLRRQIDGFGVNYSSGESGGAAWNGGGVVGASAVKVTENQALNILQSMGQSVHMFDLTGRIIYWSRTAEILYGFMAAEALGKNPNEIIVEPEYLPMGYDVIRRMTMGECWCGEFPVRNKRGETFDVLANGTSLFDENGILIGGVIVSTDTRPYQGMRPTPSVNPPRRITQQPLQSAMASRISNLASKVKAKIKTGNNFMDHEDDEYVMEVNFTKIPPTDSSDSSENKLGIHKIISLKAEEWMGKRGIAWPWKGNEREGGPFDSRNGHFGWPWLHNDQEHEPWEAQGSWSSSLVNSTSSSGSLEIDSFDYDILWEDLIMGQQIGQGSCGTVHHAMWCGSDVAVKVFSKQEFSIDVILPFKQEVSLMKKLRHPNILLFMGAVTSPQRLCIVTEFLPRGSLFRLLQRNTTKFDWRRRVNMAMDIARGMNYLHHCHPPVIHRDLKSSNLLVDKNWTVKVGDFGLSRIKHETYLATKTGKGTPQWMAPEILRNEQADEKSDVYSYGVVLWEITTEKIPWESLNSMQVIAAVGFMNQQLDIPKDVDPQWASLLESCLCSEPQSRPTFYEILDKLKILQKKFAAQLQASRSLATKDGRQKES